MKSLMLAIRTLPFRWLGNLRRLQTIRRRCRYRSAVAVNNTNIEPDPLAGIDLFATPLEPPIERYDFINSLSSDDLEAFSAAPASDVLH